MLDYSADGGGSCQTGVFEASQSCVSMATCLTNPSTLGDSSSAKSLYAIENIVAMRVQHVKSSTRCWQTLLAWHCCNQVANTRLFILHASGYLCQSNWWRSYSHHSLSPLSTYKSSPLSEDSPLLSPSPGG